MQQAAITEPIRIVSATRATADAFTASTLLGQSLAVLRQISSFETEITFENRDGLPAVYNRAIARAKEQPAILVFLHDDVYLADTLWTQELRRMLTLFDILGLAGNRRRTPKQPSWAFCLNGNVMAWDVPPNLSGAVGHGELPGKISLYGPPHQPCMLLDGLFLAARSQTLLERGVGFDPQFSFHFYDLDFCRQAELKGLKMGTAAIKVIHKSGGTFRSPAWMNAYQVYLQKYGQ